MIQPRLYLCSGAPAPAETEDRLVVHLDALGDRPNVTIRINDMARVFHQNLAGRALDLLEVAAYVFTADAGTPRGSQWQDDAVEAWPRDIKLVIPVRDTEFWTRTDVIAALTKTLGFLSNDKWAFHFVPLHRERQTQEYLELGMEDWQFKSGISRVIMFSGGLDSLAGAVEAAKRGEKLVLVSHRSVSIISSRQRKLFQALRKKFPACPMLHVPVWINKVDRFGHEPSQRTRSFLFTALGTVVSQLVGAGGVRFYENGIVSLNLPVADEVVRARASRTTHPLAIRYLEQFARLVVDNAFVIDNPYLGKTKAEVIGSIAANGAGDLIGMSVSCAHTRAKSVSQQHCGTCSQCIDRRMGVFAAGLDGLDPETDYVSDVFTGRRDEGYERNIAVHYARHATELHRMSEEEFARQFNVDISRAVRGTADSNEAARELYDLHQRHAAAVLRVLAEQMQQNAGALVRRSLEPTSMLALIAGQQHQQPLWDAYCERIHHLLQLGLPKACATHPAKDEPHLQELCDGILAPHDDQLVREFPFMRWSASLTKPDWSHESFGLWIELKYVRKKADIRVITEDIAADITKYGDNGRRVLFVVYDPKHLILDENRFATPIIAREQMRVAFIR
jgi:hypothetical protein